MQAVTTLEEHLERIPIAGEPGWRHDLPRLSVLKHVMETAKVPELEFFPCFDDPDLFASIPHVTMSAPEKYQRSLHHLSKLFRKNADYKHGAKEPWTRALAKRYWPKDQKNFAMLFGQIWGGNEEFPALATLDPKAEYWNGGYHQPIWESTEFMDHSIGFFRPVQRLLIGLLYSDPWVPRIEGHEFAQYDPIVGMDATTLADTMPNEIRLSFLGKHYRTERQKSAASFQHVFGFEAPSFPDLKAALLAYDHEHRSLYPVWQPQRGSQPFTVTDASCRIRIMSELERLSSASKRIFRDAKESGLFSQVMFLVTGNSTLMAGVYEKQYYYPICFDGMTDS